MTEQSKILANDAACDTPVRSPTTARSRDNKQGHHAEVGRSPPAPGHGQEPDGGRSPTSAPSLDVQVFHITPLQPCPYLPGRMERKLWTELGGRNQEEFSRLTQKGFRRSHRIAYKPACPRCQACLPVRIPVAEFQWSRSLRRVMRGTAGYTLAERPTVATSAQFALFSRYLDARHQDGEMAQMSQQDFRQMVEEAPSEARVLELSAPTGAVAAACLMDAVHDGLSAVYSFFDPDLAHLSLGTRMILALVEEAAARRLPYVYLGYWVEGGEKMRYKGRFRPLEVLVGGSWHKLGASPADSASA